ncbi:MAG: alpha/beta hydrolase, partial [Marmoricola sp.]|nr:alpha/beta hydrolase [Marmoricola sp.]
MTSPRLISTRLPRDPAAVALVLHGGGAREAGTAVSPTQLSVLRMLPVAGRLARAGRGRLAVFRLLNSTRGWDSSHTPVDDARWALDQIAERLGSRL